MVGFLAGIRSMVSGIAIGSVIGGVASSASMPATQGLTYEINKLTTLQEFDPNTLVILKFRNEITDDEFLSAMKKNGFSEAKSRKFIKASVIKHSAEEYIDLYSRGYYDKKGNNAYKTMLTKLDRLGYPLSEAEEKYRLSQYKPGSDALHHFAVREVFDSSVVNDFGLDNSYPAEDPVFGPEYSKHLRAAQVPKDIDRMEWRAHWVPPSLERMYESLHRFSKEDRQHWVEDVRSMGLDPDLVETELSHIEKLVKVADYIPRFHSNLIALSYGRILRVDTRRLVRFGMIDYDYTLYLNKANGNTSRNAQLLTKFTFVNENISKWRDEISTGLKTKEQILKEAEDWHITTAGADDWETALNANMIDSITRELDIEVEKKMSEDKNFTKSEILKSYEYGISTKDECKTNLMDLGYAQKEADFIIANVDIRIEKAALREKRSSALTQSQLKAAFKKELITEEQYRKKLAALGESEFSIDIQVALARDDKKDA